MCQPYEKQDVPILSWYHSSWYTEPDLPGSYDITKARPFSNLALRVFVCLPQSGP